MFCRPFKANSGNKPVEDAAQRPGKALKEHISLVRICAYDERNIVLFAAVVKDSRIFGDDGPVNDRAKRRFLGVKRDPRLSDL